MAADTLLINGHDIRAQTGVSIVGSLDSILIPPGSLRGSNPVVPGARGERGADLPIAAYTGSVTLFVKGATRAAKTANLRAFLSTIRNGTTLPLCTLERRLDNGTSYDASTAAGQILGNAWKLMNFTIGQTLLEIRNLSGLWSPDGGTTWEF